MTCISLQHWLLTDNRFIDPFKALLIELIVLSCKRIIECEILSSNHLSLAASGPQFAQPNICLCLLDPNLYLLPEVVPWTLWTLSAGMSSCLIVRMLVHLSYSVFYLKSVHIVVSNVLDHVLLNKSECIANSLP